MGFHGNPMYGTYFPMNGHGFLVRRNVRSIHVNQSHGCPQGTDHGDGHRGATQGRPWFWRAAWLWHRRLFSHRKVSGAPGSGWINGLNRVFHLIINGIILGL